MQAHGIERFKFEVIETVSTYEVGIAREIYWIAEYKKLAPGVYNTVYGVRGVLSYEHRSKLSRTLRGRKLSTPPRAKISEAHQGRFFSSEHRARIAATLRGRPLSAEHCAKLSVAHRGKKHSEETRAKISSANLGRTLSATQKYSKTWGERNNPLG